MGAIRVATLACASFQVGGPDNLFVRVAKRQEEAARTSRHRVNGSLWRRRQIPARSASECINTTYALLDKPAVAPNAGNDFFGGERSLDADSGFAVRCA